MKRTIIHTELFSEDLDDLIVRKRLSDRDYEDFEQSLVYFPTQGDVIQGTGGLRKTRKVIIKR